MRCCQNLLPISLLFSSFVVAYNCNTVMSPRRRIASSVKLTRDVEPTKRDSNFDNNEIDFKQENFLEDWVNHDSTNFHYFAPEEAAEIRETLLTWYGANRRKLPWRGDPPPYDGSTAGIATRTNVKKKGNNQSSITSYFGASTNPERASRAPRQAPNRKEGFGEAERKGVKGHSSHAIPVSAYGVWVSEIMLQQTRVEAVIPYWQKCTYIVTIDGYLSMPKHLTRRFIFVGAFIFLLLIVYCRDGILSYSPRLGCCVRGRS